MAITAAQVKELRESTGAGMMDAKKALTETNGDMEAAVDWLRTKGLAKAAKKSGRVAAECFTRQNREKVIESSKVKPRKTTGVRLLDEHGSAVFCERLQFGELALC